MGVDASIGVSAGGWQRIWSGLATALLLLPIPAFAAIQGFSWGNPEPSGDLVFDGVDASATTSATAILKLTLAAGNSKIISEPTTWSITAHFNVTDGASILGGNWTGLDNISDINGIIKVQITLTGNGTTNHLFGSPETIYDNNHPPPSSQNLTFSEPLSEFNGYSVTILFTFNNGTGYSAASSPHQLILTLN